MIREIRGYAFWFSPASRAETRRINTDSTDSSRTKTKKGLSVMIRENPWLSFLVFHQPFAQRLEESATDSTDSSRIKQKRRFIRDDP
jgi:hypothetical protein